MAADEIAMIMGHPHIQLVAVSIHFMKPSITFPFFSSRLNSSGGFPSNGGSLRVRQKALFFFYKYQIFFPKASVSALAVSALAGSSSISALP
jgi:hypothetical protein